MLESDEDRPNKQDGPLRRGSTPMSNMQTLLAHATDLVLPESGLERRAHPREPVAKVEKVIRGRDLAGHECMKIYMIS